MTEVQTRRILVLDSGRIGPALSIQEVLGPDPAVLGSVTIIDPLETALDPDALPGLATRAMAHADELGPAAAGPHTVVAHCTNTALAFALAAELAARGCPEPQLVVFAPTLVDRELVADHAAELLGALGLPKAEVEAFTDRVWSAAAAPAAALELTCRRLRELTTAEAEASGFDHEEAEVFAAELSERYERWLSHLTGQLDVTFPGAALTVDLVDDDLAGGRGVLARVTATGTVREHHCDSPTAFSDPALHERFRWILALPAAASDPSLGEM
ncbi:hypothetical protein [Kitasatospora cineracea]|uniref:hypothetical protein n=1 Tax=Kitasatospora cineracea TaxID=88074 RepID=UPI0033F2923E